MKRRTRLIPALVTLAAAVSIVLSAPLAGGLYQEMPAAQETQSGFRFLTPPVIQWSTPGSFEVFAITSHSASCAVLVREKDSTGDFTPVTNHQHGLVQANETWHRIKVPGLIPGKVYEYQVQARRIEKFEPYKVHFGSSLTTETYTVTLPSINDTELNFTVLNDLHKNIELIGSLMKKVAAAPAVPQFVILNGDILSHIEGEEDVASILDMPVKYGSEHPLLWIRGNHECRGDFARHMTRYLAMPDGRYYFSFRRGPVQFLVLDSGEDKDDSDPAYCGLTDFDTYRGEEEIWFREIIQSREWKNAPFRILVTHIPVGHVPGDEERDQKFFQPYKKRWAELMNSAGLDLEIAGHYHRYYLEDPSDKRNFPLVIGGGPSEDSTVIIRVHATEEILSLDVTNLKDEKIGSKQWEKVPRNQ